MHGAAAAAKGGPATTSGREAPPAAQPDAHADGWHRLLEQTRHLAARPPQAQTPLLPAPWFRAARRWSPGVFPPLLALLLLGIIALAGRVTGAGMNIVPAADVLPLALLYLIGGTLYGVGLYYAPTNNIWLSILAGGAVLYFIATLGVLTGPLAAIMLIVLLAVPVYMYVRRHLRDIPPQQALVTTLAGGYHRTLTHGAAILIPGERELATVDTNERELTVPVQGVRITDREGEGFVARAAATLAYHIPAAQAHLAALAADTWEGDVNERAAESLRIALGEWGHRLLDGEEIPERFLARTVLDDLRPRMRPYGVSVLWVNVRDIWLTPESETIPVSEWEQATNIHPPAGNPSAYESSDNAARRNPAPRAVATPATSAPLPAIEDEALAPATSAPPESEALDPDALADAYNAVRDGLIADPETIRSIARAFLTVAGNSELAADFPYDAISAAQILLDRAAALERAMPGSGEARA
jgi:hypothetical protein